MRLKVITIPRNSYRHLFTRRHHRKRQMRPLVPGQPDTLHLQRIPMRLILKRIGTQTGCRKQIELTERVAQRNACGLQCVARARQHIKPNGICDGTMVAVCEMLCRSSTRTTPKTLASRRTWMSIQRRRVVVGGESVCGVTMRQLRGVCFVVINNGAVWLGQLKIHGRGIVRVEVNAEQQSIGSDRQQMSLKRRYFRYSFILSKTIPNF